jgi:hypothetical protein
MQILPEKVESVLLWSFVVAPLKLQDSTPLDAAKHNKAHFNIPTQIIIWSPHS